ncbi:hypothetical protein L6R52_24470 [Myxococcota bacterium]|nr:hypothetical protein [Myxococcota bacterium]
MTNTSLQAWLSNVNQHISTRRIEMKSLPRPKRNRERERARREARQLFAEYYAERALDPLAS